MQTFKSDISQQIYPLHLKVAGASLRKSLLSFIQKDHPDFNENSLLSIQELNILREKYVAHYIQLQLRDLTDLEEKVIQSISQKETLTDKLKEVESPSTFGQRAADKIASFGGSWTFILLFGAILFIWIFINGFWLANSSFDPYPFILLNLLLSCLAALQAPIIMMSQNRQEEKDRERAKKDYMVNLQSELEIRGLHEKLDHLIIHQQQELMELQKVQIEMMNDILSALSSNKKP